MTTYQFGDITLEEFKPREWRAWRWLEKGESLKVGDLRELEHGVWLETCGVGDIVPNANVYRRPVPLPSIDPELVDACWKPHRKEFQIPLGRGAWRETSDRKYAIATLRALLPGYEEQLAKASVNAVSMMFRWADGERPTEPQAPVPDCRFCGQKATCFGCYEGDRGYACDDCCGHGNEDGWCERVTGAEQIIERLSKQLEAREADLREMQQPSPVPADGWRPIETAPKDGSEVLLGGPGKRRVGRWMGRSWVVHETSDARWVMEGVTHWQPLPPPPQEKGGEA